MPGDFEILGIGETRDPEAIKRAFRARAKALHPDLAPPGDALKRHLHFAELCAAYRRLMARTKPAQSPAPRPASPASRPNDGEGLVVHADPAYVYYRRGMFFFTRIHPSQWNLDPEVLNTKIAGQEGEQDIIRKRLEGLIALFPRAYYYFSLVAQEYPDSVWAWDSGEKIHRIDEMVRRYSRILESFTTWNPDKMAAIREYHRLVETHGAVRKSITLEERRRWRKGV